MLTTSTRSDPWANSMANRLLKSLPWDLLRELEPDLIPVGLKAGEVLVENRELVESIWFPTSCLASGVVDFDVGSSVETVLIGTDGFTGIGAFLGSQRALQKVLVDVPGEALRMNIEAFRTHAEDARFRQALGEFVAQAHRIAAQSAGCIVFHPMEQRLAKWLLMIQDALDQDEFALTQEYVATMLGSHRPTVTLAERVLTQAGLAERQRGCIRLLDREGLKAAACECYEAQKLDKNN